MLGFIEWMEQKSGLTELQKEDLIQAKAVINEALNEKVSSWCPTLRNYYGEDISHKLKFTNGYTAALNYKNDGISYENLMALPDYFVQVKKYYASKDIYREACLRIYKEKYPEYLGSEGLPRTNFLINTSAMVGADRNAFVNYHADPNKWHDDVASEVLYSDDNAEGAILAWTYERKLFDQAKKELKINTSYLTEAYMRELEDLALKKGDIGHYIFFLYATSNTTMGFGQTQRDKGERRTFDSNSVGQDLYNINEDNNFYQYTFDEMTRLLNEYRKFLSSNPYKNAYAAAKVKYNNSNNQVKELEGILKARKEAAKKGNAWVRISNKWYCIDKSGKKFVTGWKKLNKKWYHFNKSGVMATGWIKSDSSWYLSNSSGAWIK